MAEEIKIDEGKRLAARMLAELSAMKYAYADTVRGCYDSLANHYGFAIPQEGKGVIVAAVPDLGRYSHARRRFMARTR
jgi:hypothetical protein